MSTATETPYVAAQRAVSEAHERAAAMRKRHEQEASAAQAEIDEAVATLRHLKAGTPPDVKLLAEHVIKVYGPERCSIEEGPGALKAAIQDLIAGGRDLAETPRGTKSYEGWAGQRFDGYGSPKHGTIRFRISLTEEAQKRLKEGGELTAEEIEAAVHYLTNLPDYVANGGS